MSLPRRLLIVLIVLALASLAGVSLLVDGFARSTLEQQLARAFSTKLALKQVDVDLLRGTLELSGLRVENPPGFGQEPLLAVQSFQATVRLGSLLSAPLVIERATLRGARLQITMLEDGSVNLDRARRRSQAAETDSPTPFRVRIEQLEIVDLELVYEDQSAADQPVRARLEELGLTLFGLELGTDADRPVCDLRIGGRLASGNARAPLGVCAFAPPPGAHGFSDFSLDLYAAGIDLNPFEPYLTRAATTLLGGRYLDLGLQCRARDSRLEGQLVLRSNGGARYELPLRGTIGAPQLFDDLGVLNAFQLPREKLSRLLGAATSAGRHLRQGGRDLASGIAGMKDMVTHPTRGPKQVVDTARGLGRRGVRLVEGVLGAGQQVAEKAADVLARGTKQTLEGGETLAETLLNLTELLNRTETDLARTRRQTQEQQRFRAALRQMLERRRQAALDLADDVTAGRLQRELDALAVRRKSR